MTEGLGVFTTPETASTSSPRTRFLVTSCLAAAGHEHGPVRPVALDGKKSLTPLSRFHRPFTLTHLRACFATPALFQSEEVGRKREETAEVNVDAGP